MEHDSSFNKQLRKEITARAVMNKQIKKLENNIDENNKKIYDIDLENKRIKKAIPKKKKKKKNYTDLCLRVIELKNSKTVIRNEIDALNQIISQIEEVKDEVKVKIKQLKRKLKTFLKKIHLISQIILKSKKKIMR